MIKLLIIIFILSLSQISMAQGNFIYPFKKGNYFEYLFQTENGANIRYNAVVVSDTLINNLRFSTLQIYDEPPLGDYQIHYVFDTTTKTLYNGSNGCLDSNNRHTTISFEWSPGHVWNTCSDTNSSIYFRSKLVNLSISTTILNTGIPLTFGNRIDTVGFPIQGNTYWSFSEMFGFLFFHREYGNPFGTGWYQKELKGAIIDSIIYGQVLINITPLNNNLPLSYSLKQNFPNPFNPSTKIQFDIPKSTHITIKVFDMLGKEVAELVNEPLKAGSYETTFNANLLTNGVYFYRLETKDYSETKKMLLLK